MLRSLNVYGNDNVNNMGEVSISSKKIRNKEKDSKFKEEN